MKYIHIPAPVTVTHTLLGQKLSEPLTFDGRRVVRERCVAANFGKDLTALTAQHKVLAAAEKMVGDMIALEDADYAYLLEATTSPEGGYNPQISHEVFAFFLAIKNAKSEPPAVLAIAG